MKIVFLAGKGESTNFMYNALKDSFAIEAVILEEKVSAKRMIKRRIKRLGFLRVINQLLFQTTISKILRATSKNRIREVKKMYHLNNTSIPDAKLQGVSSVNSAACLQLLKSIKPDAIVVNGTRIIGKKVLQATQAIFINTHVGITPLYRGVHGAYWALVANDAENCGVTIHEVDQGIDTGQVIRQATINISKEDNFSTYPFHQYGEAITPLKATLNDIKEGKLTKMKKATNKGKLYYHPTFTGYLYRRIFHGVK